MSLVPKTFIQMDVIEPINIIVGLLLLGLFWESNTKLGKNPSILLKQKYSKKEKLSRQLNMSNDF